MDFVIIANSWSAGVDNPTSKHRIALELVRQGHRVLWLEGAGMRAPSVGSGADRARMRRKVGAALRGAREEEVRGQRSEDGSQRLEDRGRRTEDGGRVWVVSPLFVPLPKYAVLRSFNGRMAAASARFWARRLGFRDPVLINYVPVLAEAMRGWGGRTEDRGSRSDDGGQRTGGGERGGASTVPHPDTPTLRHPGTPRVRCVYHCVDRWDAFRMYDAAVMAEMDARCCRYADLVVASSADLLRRCRERNPNTHLVLHGVDHAHFAQAVTGLARPADLPPGPVVGFFGLLSEWLDQELIERAARALPAAHFVFIGSADVPIERLRALPNLTWLGPRPFGDLPAYAAHFDVGLIPFLVNDLTRAVNPIKLREMLSAGCPVVSTALPEVEAYAGLVDPRGRAAVGIARSAEEFVDLVRARLAQPFSREARAALSAALAGETWSAKVRAILELCEGEPVSSNQ